ncbi:MAG: tyrosine-type recombinase/integrase [Dehalococcoidia bacterium]
MEQLLPIRAHIRARILYGPLGSHLDTYVASLCKEGYSAVVVRCYIRGIDVFGTWLSKHELGITDVDEAVVARFCGELGRRDVPSGTRGRLPNMVHGVRGFASFLWVQGVARRRSTGQPPTEADRWLMPFDEYLDHERGVSLGVRRTYLRYAHAFVEARFGTGTLDWSTVGADDVADFVCTQSARLKPSTCRAPVTAMRALLRFLASSGAVRPGLDRAVPTIRQWKQADLPAYLTAEEVERVVAVSGETTSPVGRDRAIVLLLVRLGLRASEVAGLTLDDIDWRAGRILVRPGKSGRERRLPLPADVGAALVVYLRQGRAERPYRTLFLLACPPYRALTASAVSAVAKRVLARAGVEALRRGSHVFRHTAATQMVRSGASFKQVADILGHARLETTAIYAKLDVDALAGVALPWPGGA